MNLHLVNFLLENNYANTEEDAFKILEASSSEFKDFIIVELFGQEYRLKKKIQSTTDSATKKNLRDRLSKVQKRNRKIKSTVSKVSRTTGRKIARSKTLKKAGKFIGRTILGSIIPI